MLIAQAYGILVDKRSKCRGEFGKNVEKAIKQLLREIKRAAAASNNPYNVGVAFGIIMDKNAYGDDKFRKEQKEKSLNKKERREEYNALMGK